MKYSEKNMKFSMYFMKKFEKVLKKMKLKI